MDISCWHGGFCSVTIPDDWEGALDVVAADFDSSTVSTLTLNGQPHHVTSSEDLELAGVQGMLVETFSWAQQIGCPSVKICPMDHTSLPGPWGDTPWTCTASGDPCTSPFILNGLSFSACTQQLSDPHDADQDGSLHNGHPRCESQTGLSMCGPCNCAAGEEQTYNVSSVYPHTQSVGLVTCAPCEAGRFKSFGGEGRSDSCEVCPPGTSSPSGATACTSCLPGMFNEHEMLECASCQAGFFGDGVALTVCQECGDGFYTSTEQSTACDGCLQGSSLIAKDTGCQQCSPGKFRNLSMSACSLCGAGRFQNASGQSGCHQCSAVVNLGEPNSHLWTTMSRNELMEWQEIPDSQHAGDCGCAEGAWRDGLGQCQECGEGINCKGMGEVEVLPGYFASADRTGYVWRCHGADWARCPGGRPGTCAQSRLNTSIACEECEPYTRMTNDGPCKARCVLLVVVCAPTLFSKEKTVVSEQRLVECSLE